MVGACVCAARFGAVLPVFLGCPSAAPGFLGFSGSGAGLAGSSCGMGATCHADRGSSTLVAAGWSCPLPCGCTGWPWRRQASSPPRGPSAIAEVSVLVGVSDGTAPWLLGAAGLFPVWLPAGFTSSRGVFLATSARTRTFTRRNSLTRSLSSVTEALTARRVGISARTYSSPLV